MRAAGIWAALAACIGVPVALAAASPFLEWRTPVYVAAGFAGIVALSLVLLQPLLVGGYLPGLASMRGRRAHRWVGLALLAAVAVHVAGLWVTSPPDMIDALTLASPTPFSPFGVAAMWAIVAVAALTAIRGRLRNRSFRLAHMALAIVIVGGGIAHAWLIEGTMETVSKAALCLLIVAATAKAMIDLRVFRRRRVRQTVPPAEPV